MRNNYIYISLTECCFSQQICYKNSHCLRTKQHNKDSNTNSYCTFTCSLLYPDFYFVIIARKGKWIPNKTRAAENLVIWKHIDCL